MSPLRPLRRGGLARREELELRPALLCELEGDVRRREIDELAGMIARDVRRELLRELVDERVLAPDPASGRYGHGLEHALDPVFVAEPVRGDLELERTDRAQDQVVA